MHSVFISGEIIGFDRKEDFTSDFKDEWRFEEAPSIKGSKVEENSRRHGRVTGMHGLAPEPDTSTTGKHCAQACAYARAAVPVQPSARFCDFPSFYLRFSGIFGGLLRLL